MIAQSRFTGILRCDIGVEAEEFLRRVGQQPREDLCGRVPGVEILSFGGHAQRIMITANLHAFAATFAEIGNKNAEKAATAWRLLFVIAENGCDCRISE